MTQPGRKYSAGGGYRYGFNGKENNNEVKGSGNALDFGAREFDPRIGRWSSADPKKGEYTGWSPYHFGFNSPITTIDPNGKENIVVVGTQHDNTSGNKLMFVHQALRELIKYSKNEAEESRSMLLFTEGYTPKQIRRIEQQAAKYGVSVVKVSSAEQVISYINTKNIEGGAGSGMSSPAREEDKITNIDAFSHGVVFKIEFGYKIGAGGKTNNNMGLNSVNVTDINSDAFKKEAVFTSYACRTGLGNSNINAFINPLESTIPKASLTQEIADAAKITVRAYMVRSDYSITLSTKIERLDYKIYSKIGPGGHDRWFNAFKKRVEAREKIEGATFDPEGALHGVIGGSTPVGVSSAMHEYKPNAEPKRVNTTSN
ncbi:MAG: hypothetical protein EOO43_05355 [Flavobacterium sp.]|nr:MAG: hypothetical protein EOO43_05355 [Flavobacterium sp.]